MKVIFTHNWTGLPVAPAQWKKAHFDFWSLLLRCLFRAMDFELHKMRQRHR